MNDVGLRSRLARRQILRAGVIGGIVWGGRTPDVTAATVRALR